MVYWSKVDTEGLLKLLKGKNKVSAKFGNTSVYFPSLNDLLKMKQAAGRPKDLEDLKYLKKLKKL